MAKIIYYSSPVGLPKEIKTKKRTIGAILEELDLLEETLGVSINGEYPDELDYTYEIKPSDHIEIKRVVHGGNSASEKRTLAIIVNVAALVITMGTDLSSWARLGVLLTASLVSGALNYRAAKLELAQAQTADNGEIEAATNSYSLTNVNNEARPLQPMMLPMGAHRVVPDVFAPPRFYIGNQDITVGEQNPLLSEFLPGIDFGPENVNSRWATMPANYIASGFPLYPIKIAPYFFNIPAGPISPGDNTMVIDYVKNKYLATVGPSKMVFDPAFGNAPLVIYHSDPTDTYYKKYNVFHFVARAYQLSDYAGMAKLFNNTVSLPLVTSFWETTIATKNLLKTGVSINYFYPSTLNLSDDYATTLGKIYNFLYALNNSDYSSVKTDTYAIEMQDPLFGITSVKREGIVYSTQLFNYGIGDLTISDRLVSANVVDVSPTTKNAQYSFIRKNPISAPLQWTVPNVEVPFYSPPDLPPAEAAFYKLCYNIERKELINFRSTEDVVDVNNFDEINWVYLDGKKGHDTFDFFITGNVYSTNTSTGFASNDCDIEIQWKISDETTWRKLEPYGVLRIQNNNTNKFHRQVVINETVTNDTFLNVRIRKMQLDSNNAQNGKVASVYVEYAGTKNFDGTTVRDEDMAPLNIDGLLISALVDDAGATNRYSAYVESKCWVYDFEEEEWTWDYNRNPAFWFLYFAYGGFKNLEADGTFSYPYSPTIGWVNYPGHADNIEQIFGVGLTNDEIDLDQILAWAEFCETQNLKMDMVLKDDTSCADVLERIANVGRGSVTYYNGKLSVVYEDAEQVPTFLFGMGNIKSGSFSVDYLVSDPAGKVITSYVDRETWETKTVEADVPFANADNLKVVQVNLEGVTETAQAQRECNILAARQFFQRRNYSWEVDVEGLLVKRGDLCYLSHDSTQYGYSGRISKYIIDSGIIIGVYVSSILNSEIEYITIRSPDGVLKNYSCTVNGNYIAFTDVYNAADAPYYMTLDGEEYLNTGTSFPNSIPEDFIFIAGAKETPGKIVRIASIQASGDYSFKITAVDEDPAMWSYEFDSIDEEDLESFDDAEVSLSVEDVEVKYLDNGLVKIRWSGTNADLVQIINVETNLPLEANGSYTFSGGEVTVELTPNHKYTLEVKPFAIGTPYKSSSKKVVVWTT